MKFGIDRLLSEPDLLQELDGRRVALVAHPASVTETLQHSLDALVAYSTAIWEQKTSNQVSLFGEAGDDLPEPRLSPVGNWLPAEGLAASYGAQTR